MPTKKKSKIKKERKKTHFQLRKNQDSRKRNHTHINNQGKSMKLKSQPRYQPKKRQAYQSSFFFF